jgi:hypothetical protein
MDEPECLFIFVCHVTFRHALLNSRSLLSHSAILKWGLMIYFNFSSLNINTMATACESELLLMIMIRAQAVSVETFFSIFSD